MKIEIQQGGIHTLPYQSVSKIIENLSKQMRGILSSLTYINNLSDDMRRLLEIQTRLSTSLAPLIEYQSQHLKNLISPSIKTFVDTLQSYPSRIQTAIMALANHGWFYDLEMPLPFLWDLEKELENNNLADVDLSLIEYFQKRSTLIEKRLALQFPHRAKIISAAFKAHKNSVYELSIPVFLAQADGICYEMTKQYLFIKKDKKPSTAVYVETITSSAFRSALLFPLANPLPISASENERVATFDELNRHQILHGEAVNYGTVINSTKSISLLNYVSQVLRLDKGD